MPLGQARQRQQQVVARLNQVDRRLAGGKISADLLCEVQLAHALHRIAQPTEQRPAVAAAGIPQRVVGPNEHA